MWCKLCPCGVLVCACVKNRLCTFMFFFTCVPTMSCSCVVIYNVRGSFYSVCACVLFVCVSSYCLCVGEVVRVCLFAFFCVFVCRRRTHNVKVLQHGVSFFSREFCFRVFSCCIFHRFFRVSLFSRDFSSCLDFFKLSLVCASTM